jgi:hypothetical protein
MLGKGDDRLKYSCGYRFPKFCPPFIMPCKGAEPLDLLHARFLRILGIIPLTARVVQLKEWHLVLKVILESRGELILEKGVWLCGEKGWAFHS